MAKLRIGSRGSQLALWQAHHISALLRSHELQQARRSETKMERIVLLSARIWKTLAGKHSTLVLLKWGFGEHYQCGYWAALENRGSRLPAAARGSNPLLSAWLRDPRNTKRHLIQSCFLTSLPAGDTISMVLKRGIVSVLQGGPTGRLWFLANSLTGFTRHA
jgi:Porphobilinogen deaminase, dipyromethane cofactor binding domain